MSDRPPSFDRLPVWVRVGALVGALTLVSVLILIAFAWPTSSARPRDLPMVVAPVASATCSPSPVCRTKPLPARPLSIEMRSGPSSSDRAARPS